jgi:hypothetical protein
MDQKGKNQEFFDMYTMGYGFEDDFRYIRNVNQRKQIMNILSKIDPYCLDKLDRLAGIPDSFHFKVSKQRIETKRAIIVPTLMYKQTSIDRNRPLYAWFIILNYIPSGFSFNYVSAPGMYQAISRFINIYKTNQITEGSTLSYYRKDDHDALFLSNILISTLLHDYTYSNQRVGVVGVISNCDLNMLPFFKMMDEPLLFGYNSVSYSRELADVIFSTYTAASARFYYNCSAIYNHVFSSRDNIELALRLFGRFAWKSGYDGEQAADYHSPDDDYSLSIRRKVSTFLGIGQYDIKPNPFCFDFMNNEDLRHDENINKSSFPIKVAGYAVRKNQITDSSKIICLNSI